MKLAYRLFLLAVMLLAVVANGVADNLSFNPTIKFRFQSTQLEGNCVGIGSQHDINSPLCIAEEGDDCYWYLQEYKVAQFALCNAKTGQYVVLDNVRSENPFRRYVHLENIVRNDSALWRIVDRGNGVYSIQSAVAPSYYFNIRGGNQAVGGYSGSNGTSANELFMIIKDDNQAYDPNKDLNYICGKDKEGFYWTSVVLQHPVVATTDDSNPVYYYITNVRSGNYVSPENYLLQELAPKSRFYFKEAKDGMQILVEGGGYVSGLLPNSTSTTPYDVKVATGTPAANDHTWAIDYYQDWEYPGYSIGVATCSANLNNNVNIKEKWMYWNDFQQFGLCFYAVDGGSTFAFHSKDERHREYLAGLGLVIPTDSIAPVDPPVDPDDPDNPDNPDDSTEVDLEPITGAITFVHRADGKVDAIPQQYIQNISDADGEIVINIRHNGPQYTYHSYEVDSISTNQPSSLPAFKSFKFNNKFNHHLHQDAEGVFQGDTLITLDAMCIGKRLRPSFKIDADAEVYIGNQLQHSKVTRTRYDKDVVYTIARRGHTILRRTLKGEFVSLPYGRRCVVKVNFATDNSRGEYKVPTVYITTDNGSSINSKYYYWDAHITIDGAGVFPDMPETAMQIKGRGNSSWTATGKAPYHMKFETAVKPFGLTKGKHWNLIANAQTRSMTTNAVAMKMAQLVETAGFNHEIPVELYINGQYRGSYNLTEKVGFSNNSIDLADETHAVMLELDSYYDEAYKFRTTKYYLPVNIKEPDFSEGTTPLSTIEINQDFNRAITALYNREDMKYYFDLDYLARFLFVDEFAFNTEFMHPKSTFLYKEDLHNSDGLYVFGPVWDFDWGYGYEGTGTYFQKSPSTDYWTSVSMEETSWVYDMRYNCSETLNKKYYQLWHDFINNGSLDELVEFCQDYYDFAKESFTHDNTMWYHGDAKTYATVTENAMKWLRDRANYIYNYMSDKLGYASKGYLDESTGKLLVGDVNGDGAVTTADLVCVLNYMLSLPNEDFEYDAADVDKNNMITIGDAVAVRDLVGTQATKSGRFYSLPEADAAIYAGVPTVTAASVSVPLTINVASGNYSGLQFDLRVPAGMVIEDLDINKAIPEFDISIAELDNSEYADPAYDRYRVSIYSSALNTLPVGKSQLELLLGWSCGDKAKGLLASTLSNVMFVNAVGEDERSNSYTAQFVADELTGINDVASLVQQDGHQLTFRAGEDTVIAVYGVDGRVFHYYDLKAGTATISLPTGIYIINKQKITVH